MHCGKRPHITMLHNMLCEADQQFVTKNDAENNIMRRECNSFHGWLHNGEVLPLSWSYAYRTFRDSNSYNQRFSVAVALKFTVHAFIKGHRKSGVISIKHSS